MAKRVDANHGEIRDGMRQRFVFVIDTHAVGDGFPDLVAWTPQRGWRLLEVKTARGRLSPAERKLHAESPGPIDVVRTLGEALRVMGIEEASNGHESV